MQQKAKQQFIWLTGFITFLCFLTFFYQLIIFLIQPAFPNTEPVDYILEQGGSSKKLAYDLHEKGLLRHPYFFILMARLEGKADVLKAGGYTFAPGITAQEILTKIYRGEFARHKITFIEGWTLQEMRVSMAKDNYLQHNTNEWTEQQIAQQFGITEDNPEGWFFPDTYQFVWGDTEQQILQMAHQKMQLHLKQEWENRAPGLWYKTPYQALIAASLIEKEARLSAERPIIASVILRRLKIGMPLQIDSTIIYALGNNYNGKITRADLQTKSPYNTYLNYGLPPTPIAAPGLDSLHAALHPDETNNALYFVARGDGSHQFSDSLSGQNTAIKKYILKDEGIEVRCEKMGNRSEGSNNEAVATINYLSKLEKQANQYPKCEPKCRSAYVCRGRLDHQKSTSRQSG